MTLTPHGRLIEAARESRGMSKRAAANSAGISEGYWRQVVTGVASHGGGVTSQVRPRREKLVVMAQAVGAPVARVLEAAGMEAHLDDLPVGEPASFVVTWRELATVSNEMLLAEIGRRFAAADVSNPHPTPPPRT